MLFTWQKPEKDPLTSLNKELKFPESNLKWELILKGPDAGGAEKLLGAGDMLYQGAEMSKPMRIQSAYISEKEVKSVTKYLRDAYAEELQDEINNKLYQDVARHRKMDYIKNLKKKAVIKVMR